MIINLKPTADELADLRTITEANLNQILDYTPTDTLEFVLPFDDDKLTFLSNFDNTDIPTAVANAVDTQFIIKNVIASGGRVFVMMPDSDKPQEFTFENEK